MPHHEWGKSMNDNAWKWDVIFKMNRLCLEKSEKNNHFYFFVSNPFRNATGVFKKKKKTDDRPNRPFPHLSRLKKPQGDFPSITPPPTPFPLSVTLRVCRTASSLRLSLWQVGDRVFAACPLSRLSEQGASAFSTRFDRRTWQARGRDGVFIFLPTAYDRGTDCEWILGSKMLISDSFALEEIDKKIYFLS